MPTPCHIALVCVQPLQATFLPVLQLLAIPVGVETYHGATEYAYLPLGPSFATRMRCAEVLFIQRTGTYRRRIRTGILAHVCFPARRAFLADGGIRRAITVDLTSGVVPKHTLEGREARLVNGSSRRCCAVKNRMASPPG